MLQTGMEALDLLKSLGASDRLIRHLEIVGETGEELIRDLVAAGISFDTEFVRLGIAVHDAGKIVHPKELTELGSEHETAGEALLLQHGIQPSLARCCISHARYDRMAVSFEELLIALADKLWKGKRVSKLELQVIDGAAASLGVDRWNLFSDLDSRFEAIASKADDRLAKSNLSSEKL